MTEESPDNTFKFECQRCGECCRRPGLITSDDLGRISEHFGMSMKEAFEKYFQVFENMICAKVNKIMYHLED